MINAFENLLSIELNEYGLCVDTAWFYIALDYRFLTTALLITIGYKVYKKIKRDKWASLVKDEFPNDEWSN
jgi:hypothetical protein